MLQHILERQIRTVPYFPELVDKKNRSRIANKVPLFSRQRHLIQLPNIP